MFELSPLRVGRITGSRVGKILGVSRFGSADDVMREMVREYHGVPSEFTGNVATDWGKAHEPDAVAEYERNWRVLTTGAQVFHKHPVHDFLGATPDGLVGSGGVLEVKCPYRATYDSIEERPEYYHQVQLLLECTDRDWCDFVIWRPDQPLIMERVQRDSKWLPQYIDALEKFHLKYMETVSSKKLSAAHLESVERTDKAWQLLARQYLDALNELTAAEELVEKRRQALIVLSDGKPARGSGVQVYQATRKGTVDYKRMISEVAPDVDLDRWRKPCTVTTTVRLAKENEEKP